MATKKVQTKECRARWHEGEKILPINSFPTWSETKDSHSPWSKACWKVYVREYKARKAAEAEGASQSKNGKVKSKKRS